MSSSSDDEVEMIILEMLESSSDDDNQHVARRPQRDAPFTGQEYTIWLINGHPDTIRDILRVDAATFRSLIDALVEHGQLQWDHKRLSLEESLAIFLYICGHSQRHRSAADRFQHSTDTICRHFKYVRRALCNLGRFVIQPPNLLVTPPEILHDQRYMPWFQVYFFSISLFVVNILFILDKLTKQE